MTHIINIKSNLIKEYKTSKYRYKKIKQAIEELFIEYEFFEDINILLKVRVINKSRFIVLISINNYNINNKILINNDDYKLKTIKEDELNKNTFLKQLTKAEHLRFNNTLPEAAVAYPDFLKNKHYYKGIYNMSMY